MKEMKTDWGLQNLTNTWCCKFSICTSVFWRRLRAVWLSAPRPQQPWAPWGSGGRQEFVCLLPTQWRLKHSAICWEKNVTIHPWKWRRGPFWYPRCDIGGVKVMPLPDSQWGLFSKNWDVRQEGSLSDKARSRDMDKGLVGVLLIIFSLQIPLGRHVNTFVKSISAFEKSEKKHSTISKK